MDVVGNEWWQGEGSLLVLVVLVGMLGLMRVIFLKWVLLVCLVLSIGVKSGCCNLLEEWEKENERERKEKRKIGYEKEQCQHEGDP